MKKKKTPEGKGYKFYEEAGLQQLSIHIPSAAHKRLKGLAERRGVSLQLLARTLLMEGAKVKS